MTKTLYFLCLIFILVACTSPEPAFNNLEDGILSNEQVSILNNNFNIFPNRSEVSIALIKDGEVQFFGVKRNKDTLQHISNKNNCFEIGSISKVFTSTILANLVIEGKISLEEKANNHIPYQLKDNYQVSFTELANHTSGFPRMPSNFRKAEDFDSDNPYKTYDESMMQDYLSTKLKVDEGPRKSSYSNLGVGFLGYTLSQVEDQDYESLLHKYITDTLEMGNTTSRLELVQDKLVKGRNPHGRISSNWELNSMVGAGGILSTTNDLSKFALAQFDSTSTAMKLTREKTFKVSDDTDIGLGWFIIHENAGDTWYWHNGGTGGYTSSMAMDIDRKNGVIILSNISSFHDDSNLIDNMCFSLMKTLRD